MSILNIVLFVLLILILLSTLIVLINKCGGVNGISYFILIVIAEIMMTPLFAYFVQIFLNIYNFLITGDKFGDGNDNLIMYSPISVLLISGLIISFFILLLRLSWNKEEF